MPLQLLSEFLNFNVHGSQEADLFVSGVFQMKQLKFIGHFLNHFLVENNSVVAKTEINVNYGAVNFVRAHSHLFSKLETFLNIVPDSKLHIVLILVMFEIGGKLVDYHSKISRLYCLRVKTISKVLLHKEYEVVTEQEN